MTPYFLHQEANDTLDQDTVFATDSYALALMKIAQMVVKGKTQEEIEENLKSYNQNPFKTQVLAIVNRSSATEETESEQSDGESVDESTATDDPATLEVSGTDSTESETELTVEDESSVTASLELSESEESGESPDTINEPSTSDDDTPSPGKENVDEVQAALKESLQEMMSECKQLKAKNDQLRQEYKEKVDQGLEALGMKDLVYAAIKLRELKTEDLPDTLIKQIQESVERSDAMRENYKQVKEKLWPGTNVQYRQSQSQEDVIAKIEEWTKHDELLSTGLFDGNLIDEEKIKTFVSGVKKVYSDYQEVKSLLFGADEDWKDKTLDDVKRAIQVLQAETTESVESDESSSESDESSSESEDDVGDDTLQGYVEELRRSNAIELDEKLIEMQQQRRPDALRLELLEGIIKRNRERQSENLSRLILEAKIDKVKVKEGMGDLQKIREIKALQQQKLAVEEAIKRIEHRFEVLVVKIMQ